MLPLFLGELAFGRRMAATLPNVAALVLGRAVLVGARLHLLEPRRRAGRRQRGRAVRPPDAGVRRRAGLAIPGRAAVRSTTSPELRLILTGIWITSRLGRAPCRRRPDRTDRAAAARGCDGGMDDIGNADRVALMQRLVGAQARASRPRRGHPSTWRATRARRAAAHAPEAPQAAAEGSDRAASSARSIPT